MVLLELHLILVFLSVTTRTVKGHQNSKFELAMIEKYSSQVQTGHIKPIVVQSKVALCQKKPTLPALTVVQHNETVVHIDRVCYILQQQLAVARPQKATWQIYQAPRIVPKCRICAANRGVEISAKAEGSGVWEKAEAVLFLSIEIATCKRNGARKLSPNETKDP
ncbi:hypothetical protein B0H10DRAFT_1946059 [Mycena sp. CBHHK59/15]|nr:hypothetical protein B0H10DRAFT_1946059 [Mycena sp. CBHHK59/15]